MASFGTKVLLFSLPLAIPAAFWSGGFQLPAQIQRYFTPFQQAPPSPEAPFDLSCVPHQYTTEVISTDPLLIYINNFTSHIEAQQLVAAGEPDFKSSYVSLGGRNVPSTARTSQSAALELSLPIVDCVLRRARSFMGTMLASTDEFSLPQLVRYTPSQKYDLHMDWWPKEQMPTDKFGRRYNRVASFFVFLQDNCTQGETWFPYVDVLEREEEKGRGFELGGRVRRHERGGVAFRPVMGNALFWVNLDGEGVGDRRTEHAGLPVGEGLKTALNIWPRRFY